MLLPQKYLSRLIKGALVTGFFAAIFKGQSNNNYTVHQIYEYIIKVRVYCKLSILTPSKVAHLVLLAKLFS